MSSEPTVIYKAASVQQAYLLRSLLADQGIDALVVNDAIQIAGGELPLGWAAAPQVVVAKENAERARLVARALDDSGSGSVEGVESGPREVALEWEQWPRCPRCQTKRSARCPICQTTGVEFPLADFQAGEVGERVLLVCATCDDHMRPEWYRHCASCGHDFGDGISAERPQFPSIEPEPLFLVVVSLVLLALLAVGAYFWWLFG